MNIQDLSKEQRARVSNAIADKMAEIRARHDNPAAQEQAAVETIDHAYQTMPDGVDAESGASAYDDDEDEQLTQVAETTDNVVQLHEVAQRKVQKEIEQEQQMVPPIERAPATPRTVKEKVVNFPVGPEAFRRFVEAFSQGKAPQEPQEVHESKQRHAQSPKTDVKPEVQKVVYSKDTCESQGQSISYKVAMQKVDWGGVIQNSTKSPEEAIEYITNLVTMLVKKTYGGWNRITEIIVRDQHLIINRSCVQPVLDPKTVNIELFPLDVVDYIREGAIASLFDWRNLKAMTNLATLDVDDMGFYEINIGGRLKCGRRIGVSTIFNLCKGLETLILAGDVVTRDSLNSEEATVVKKKLATHKRFSLFADGYKLNVMQNTSDLSSWTFNNLKNYANNRGNKNVFWYCGGIIARSAVAGVAGVVNLGTHLIGGIASTIKQAMTPVNPEEVGLQ